MRDCCISVDKDDDDSTDGVLYGGEGAGVQEFTLQLVSKDGKGKPGAMLGFPMGCSNSGFLSFPTLL